MRKKIKKKLKVKNNEWMIMSGAIRADGVMLGQTMDNKRVVLQDWVKTGPPDSGWVALGSRTLPDGTERVETRTGWVVRGTLIKEVTKDDPAWGLPLRTFHDLETLFKRHMGEESICQESVMKLSQIESIQKELDDLLAQHEEAA